MKKVLLSIVSGAVLLLGACGANSDKDVKILDEKKITVGVTGGPHEQIFEKVKEVAAKDGLDIDIKIFNDYVAPNVSLDEKSLDVNSYQTKSYLDVFKAERNMKLTEVFSTVTFPMGVYSKSLKDVKELKEGDAIAVPNDPTNELRALKLFEKAGVLKVDPKATEKATAKDVIENPKNLKIVELEASQLPTQLSEVKAAAINTNFALGAKLNPAKDSIFREGKDSPYVNWVVVRTENKDDAVVSKLKKAYQSKEVKEFIEKKFDGSVLPSW
ncbi:MULTISPECIES: MetQ/NlpA family ABC transporter substrate-binding protein [Bacillus]|uniref:Lipoprotein n=1 Tax=Bacillus toyonensis TaxID=155322 RepID=A0A1X3MI47_9BACI|nr:MULTISPECIES: MetQ/NlpA family ABC transporter substrate-binding protein [Bacillus]AFU16300.1 NLPA lipoprotein [Bacillus thuringiensis MC28]EEL60988.1 Glutamine--fructose-6-phosphate aminotransferase [Bacillus cereus Rock4-18]OFC95112.1 D-methionine-binding lipoprotein MetQ [Bacillus thuringiensis]OTW95493.1 metal ABC transporter substrate-binding protein [Bacillus thuringiensis serovar cameroun]OTX01753.1 metal ABC transporter substrate-binding protein [Bacillus thuringiensis serovar seoul